MSNFSKNTHGLQRRSSGCVPLFLVLLFSVFGPPRSASAQSCGSTGVAVQVLGSGGPDLRDKRASASALIWQDGKSLLLIDAGGGSALRFGESGARMSQLRAILFTHFHADHSSDLPALVLSSRFEDRKQALPVFGPPGSDLYPSTTEFVNGLFGRARGVWRYMFRIVEGGQPYLLEPHDVTAEDTPVNAFRSGDTSVDAVRTDHTARTPALAWRVAIGGKLIVFSGDTGGRRPGLSRLAENADLLIVHNATSRSSEPELKEILMPPSVIGRIAADAHVKQLVLSHRMEETLGPENEAHTREDIRRQYSGALEFANDLDCFALK